MLGLLGHLPVLIVRLSAFIVAVAMMVGAVCSLASWRRLSDQLERVRADLADRINESLCRCLGLNARTYSPILRLTRWHRRTSVVVPLTRGWPSWVTPRSMPCARRLRCRRLSRMVLAAWRLPPAVWPMPRAGMPRPSLSRRLAGKRMSRPVPSVSLSRRDLRFFNAFPRLRINRYEGRHPSLPTSATAPHELFLALVGTGRSRLPLCSRIFPFVSHPLPCRFKIAAPFPFDNAAFNNAVSGLHQLPSAALWAPTTFMRSGGAECTIRDRQRLCSSAPCSCFLMNRAWRFSMAACPGTKNVINTMLMCFWRHWPGWCAVDCCRLVAGLRRRRFQPRLLEALTSC